MLHHVLQVRGAPEGEVRERGAEVGREGAHLLSAAHGLVQRVLEPDVRGGELVDDVGVEGVAPELGEPPADDGLVLFERHGFVLLLLSPTRRRAW
ncbi:hypothetical protein ACVWZD_008997 [Streptomyces sp. TE3672]